jgi:hypothetical protein
MLKKMLKYWSALPPLLHLMLSYLLLAPMSGVTVARYGKGPPDSQIWFSYVWRLLMAVIVICAFLYPIKKEGFAQLVFNRVVQVLSALAVVMWLVVIMAIAWQDLVFTIRKLNIPI